MVVMVVQEKKEEATKILVSAFEALKLKMVRKLQSLEDIIGFSIMVAIA